MYNNETILITKSNKKVIKLGVENDSYTNNALFVAEPESNNSSQDQAQTKTIIDKHYETSMPCGMYGYETSDVPLTMTNTYSKSQQMEIDSIQNDMISANTAAINVLEDALGTGTIGDMVLDAGTW